MSPYSIHRVPEYIFGKLFSTNAYTFVESESSTDSPERGNDLSVKATVVNAGSRVERICARIDVLGLEKTVDCNEYADELEIFRDYSTALSINLADVYFYGKICFD